MDGGVEMRSERKLVMRNDVRFGLVSGVMCFYRMISLQATISAHNFTEPQPSQLVKNP